jgi:hypothetical protein
MNRKSMIVIGLVAAGVSIAVGAVQWDIKRDVSKNIRISQNAHPAESDDVASLISYVNSNEHTLAEKNHAVWTLGRIGDVRGVNALKPYFTGVKCYHVEELCQKQLRQAIKRCED